MDPEKKDMNVSATVSPWKRDAKVWSGLFLLALAMLLLNKGFMVWRNDGRNFRNANGMYEPEVKPVLIPLRRNHIEYKSLMASGLVIFAISLGFLRNLQEPAEIK